MSIYAGSYYHRVLISETNGKVMMYRYLTRANWLLLFGFILIALEPALVLFAIQVDDIAVVATILWVFGVFVMVSEMRNSRLYRIE